jgi:hypothetical protein
MASFDQKAFLSLPTGSSYLECPSENNYHSLNTGPSTDIFCAQTPKGFVFAVKVSQQITHEKMLAPPEDDPAELLKGMDALGETVRSICADGPLIATFPEADYRKVVYCPRVTLLHRSTSKASRCES